MPTATIQYLGELHCEATHSKSGKTIETDAPLDNNGRGMAFSPTDLLATSLGLCVVTIMGIKARQLNIEFDSARIEIEKIMSSNPRRVGEIGVNITVHQSFDHKTQKILEAAGRACPVARSLHPDIQQNIVFAWG